MSDLATLISAISGALVAVLGAVGGLIVTLRRVSPKERADAVANAETDASQDELIAKLEEQVRRLTERDGEEA